VPDPAQRNSALPAGWDLQDRLAGLCGVPAGWAEQPVPQRFRFGFGQVAVQADVPQPGVEGLWI